MTTAYLDAAREGQNQWWRYVIAVLLILFVWLIVGSTPLLIAATAVMLDGNPLTALNPENGTLTGVPPLATFLLIMTSFVSFFLGTVIAVRLVHRRRFTSLITPAPAVSWQRIAQGFGVWFVLAAAIAAVEAVLYPERYHLTLDPGQLLPFVAAAVVLIPIQTSAEELFFRGYLLQGFGLLTRSPLVLSLLSGLLFMLPHLGNPEVAQNFWLLVAFYFSFGAYLAWVSLKDDSLELALGVHAANNLFSAVFVNYTGSALTTPSIFTVSVLDAGYNLAGVVAAYGVFYWIFFWRRRKAGSV